MLFFFPFPSSVLHFPLYFSIQNHGNRERGHTQELAAIILCIVDAIQRLMDGTS